MVIVNGYEAIKELLVKPDFNSRPDFFRINVYRQNEGFGFSEPNACWKSLRKATFKGIRSYGHGLNRMDRILSDINERTMGKLMKLEVAEKEFDPYDIIYSHMLSSITAFTLGEQVEPTAELHDVVKRLDSLAMTVLNPAGVGATLDAAPWLRFLGHPIWKKCQELLSTRDELWELVSPSLREDAASISHSFLQARENNSDISEERVKCAIGDMMIAGTVTTTVSTYCLLQILAKHPKIQQRLQKEIDSVLGSSNQACLADLEEMPYMQATIQELHRFVTVNPLGLPHATTQNTTLAGHHIPAGTNFLPNVWGVHRDPEFWSEPSEFRPERFLTEEGTFVPADHPNRRRVLAFGMGPRLCPGENFAKGRIFMLTSAILKQYSLRSCDDVPHDPATFSLGLAIEPNHYTLKLSRKLAGTRASHRGMGEK